MTRPSNSDHLIVVLQCYRIMVNLLKICLSYVLALVLIRTLGEKNACKRHWDYFVSYASGQCYRNPEMSLTTPEILNRRQILYENHTVATEDGYILTLFRMPIENPKGVVILQHNQVADSSVWFLGYHRSVALTLHEAGYELWLPHFRGMTFSDRHADPLKSHEDYWNFSFHENGVYDLSAVVAYVTNKTANSELIYIGHSLGTTAALVYASVKPDEAKSAVKIFVTICSNVFMGGVATPLRHLLPLMPSLQAIAAKLGFVKLFPNMRGVVADSIMLFPVEFLIATISSSLWGWSPFEFQPDLVPALFSIAPQPTSLKSVFHYGQLVASGEFETYGRRMRYPLENISVPFFLIDSVSDTLVYEQGVERLYESLPTEAKPYGKLTVTELSHGDFIYGASRFDKVYDKILQLLDKIMR